MKCILLAAGYATRLYPLTKDKPKSLLEVADKTIMQHILDKVALVEEIDDIYIITNEAFFKVFNAWVATYKCVKNITVINDNTTSNDNRLGAIADLLYVIAMKELEEDILVMAGDNLFDFDLRDFVAFYKEVKEACITTHELDNEEDLKRTGVIEVNSNWRVTSFEEKPRVPKSNLAVPPFYIYKKDTLPYIKQYLEEGNNPDAPGNFIPWLISKKPVYAYKFHGKRYDIGTHESYALVNKIFSNNL